MKKTIVSVAKDLKLAPSTISKVLNNKGHISEETRKRVLDYVNEIGYIRNASARTLKSKHSFTLGVLFSDISLVGLEHPFYSAVLQAFKNYVEQNFYEVIFVVNKVGDNQMSYLDWCKTKNVDGVLILSGNFQNPLIIELVNSEIPCVSTDFYMDKLTTVVSDNKSGIKIAFNLALEKGYQRIDKIGGPYTSKAFEERTNEFSSLVNKHKTNSYFVEASGFGFNSGFQAGLKLLEEVPTKPEFVIVGSDALAFGVIRAFESKGYKVPGDISVIGFDDIEFSHLFTPSLTTIGQNKKALGITAAEQLISLIKDKQEKKQVVIKLPVELIKRNSVN